MPSAKFTQTYENITKMGEKLKAANKSGPSNDEQLQVCKYTLVILPLCLPTVEPPIPRGQVQDHRYCKRKNI